LQELYRGRTRDELRQQERDRADTISEVLMDFPLLETKGELYFRVERPTRLGNIIAAYELYAQTRYKVDVRTYWHQIVSCAPQDLRTELSDRVSFAESLVLASAAGLGVSTAATVFLVGLGLGAWRPGLVVMRVPLARAEGVAFLVGGLLCWRLFHQLALSAHRAVGTVFRALVDLAIGPFFAWLATLELPPLRERTERAAAIAEYLVYGISLSAVGTPESASALRPVDAAPPDPDGVLLGHPPSV
jgi:hypothetical protein